MKIEFRLNGKPLEVDVPPMTRLSNMLKDSTEVNSVRSSCNKGECKSCSIFFNGDIAASCLIPAFEVRNADIITLEGFSKTKEYTDIEKALMKTGNQLCDSCRGGIILTIHSILERYAEPSEDQILDAFREKICSCTNLSLIIKTVEKAAYYRKRAHVGRK